MATDDYLFDALTKRLSQQTQSQVQFRLMASQQVMIQSFSPVQLLMQSLLVVELRLNLVE